MVLIRTAMVEDADAIAHVHIESWRTTYAGVVPEAYLASLDEVERAGQWREWLTLDGTVLVAEMEGAVVGFAGGGAIREPVGSCDAELFALYLLQTAQRRGIGTSLLTAMARALEGKGFQSMAVWVLGDNASGAFYRRLGGVPMATKEVEIGGAMLPVVAYAWEDLRTLAGRG